MGDGAGGGCADEDDETGDVDAACTEDGFELSEVLVCDYGADDGGGIGPELEEVAEGCCDGLTLSKSTGEI